MKKYVEVVHITEDNLPEMLRAGCLFGRVARGILRYQEEGDKVHFVEDLESAPLVSPDDEWRVVLGGALREHCVMDRQKILIRIGFRNIVVDDEITFE